MILVYMILQHDNDIATVNGLHDIGLLSSIYTTFLHFCGALAAKGQFYYCYEKLLQYLVQTDLSFEALDPVEHKDFGCRETLTKKKTLAFPLPRLSLPPSPLTTAPCCLPLFSVHLDFGGLFHLFLNYCCIEVSSSVFGVKVL